MNGSSRRGKRTPRWLLEETRQETTRVGVATKFVKKRTVSNQVIHGVTDEASALASTSIQSRKEEVSIGVHRGGERLNRERAFGKVSWGSLHNIRTTGKACVARKLGEKMIGVEVDRESSSKREIAKVQVQARLEKRPNSWVQVANKLMIKKSIREKTT
jgi:hypothetical protein